MIRLQYLFAFTALCLPPSLAAAVDVNQLIRDAGVEEGSVAMRDRSDWRPPQKVVVRASAEDRDALQAIVPGVEIVAVSSAAEAIREIGDADAVLGVCSPDVIAAGERLQWVQIYGAGAERCLAAGAVAEGRIVMTNMQKMASPVIAEHAIAMVLGLSRALPQYAKKMPDGSWDRTLAREDTMMSLAGRKLLVAGLGGIGTEVARLAAALGMEVSATRSSSRDGPDFVRYVGLPDELHELAAEADVVVNALPLTHETTALFDDSFFAAAKPGVLFVNVARGKSVVTEALVRALSDGRVAGAGLDVTDPEPLPPGHALWQFDNVIVTPHVAWAGNNGEREKAILTENLRRFVAGDALLNVVDPALGY